MDIEDILKMDDAHRIIVEVPEWNGIKIDVCSMSAQERSDLEKKWSGKDRAGSDPAGFRVGVLSRTMKKPTGEPFGTVDQIKQLMGKNALAVERLFEAGCEVAGLTKKDMKAIEKN